MVGKNGIRGFTLVELMVAMAVLAVLLTVAVPSFQQQIKKMRVASERSRMVVLLASLRQEAIKRNAQVRMCPSSDGATCGVVGGWSGGSLLFLDKNGDGAFDAGSDEMLRVSQAAKGNMLKNRV